MNSSSCGECSDSESSIFSYHSKVDEFLTVEKLLLKVKGMKKEAVMNRTTSEEAFNEVSKHETEPAVTELLFAYGFIKMKQACDKCGKMMRLETCQVHGYKWKCTSSSDNCPIASIRKGSWFECTELPFKKCLEFLVMNSKMCSVDHMSSFLEIDASEVKTLKNRSLELIERVFKRLKIGARGQIVHAACYQSARQGGWVLAALDTGNAKRRVRVISTDDPRVVKEAFDEFLFIKTTLKAVPNGNQHPFFASVQECIENSDATDCFELQKDMLELVARQELGTNYLYKIAEALVEKALL